MTAKTVNKLKSPNPKAVREKLKLNQIDFWSPLGATQSGGSRYESGRAMPKPVRLLFELVYGNGTQDDLISGALAKSI